MEPLTLASLLLGIVALAVAAMARAGLGGLSKDIAELRARVDALSKELDSLRSVADSVPPPPLPKARTDVLQDLREQLRAAQHEEGDEATGT